MIGGERRWEEVQILDNGETTKRLAAELGLPPYTLVRWLRRAPRRSLRGVTVAAAPLPPPPALVLVTPEGWRVEGLDVAMLLHVLQRPVIGLTRQVAVYAYGAPVDMRKGFDGLSALVSQGLGHDPLSGDCYLFTNRHGSKSHSAYRSTEVEIAYPWHPLHGRRKRVTRRVRVGGQEFVHIDVSRGYSRELPAWMLQAPICDAMALGPPQVAVSAVHAFGAVLQSRLASSVSPAVEWGRREGDAHGTTPSQSMAANDAVLQGGTADDRVSAGDPTPSGRGPGRPIAGRRRRRQARRSAEGVR